MKKKITSLKTLLVAAALCVGGNAWAQTTVFSQDFTAIGESTIPGDYGFTMQTYNDATAIVTGGVLQYSLPANSSKDVSAWGTATFTAIPTENVVTVSCSWNPGGPTGTRPYSCLRVTDSDDNVVFSLYNDGQAKTLRLASFDTGTLLASGDDWRSGSIVWNVLAVLNISTQKVTSLTVTKAGESTPIVSQENIAFENTVTNISKFVFGTNKKSNYPVTSTLDNVSITYEAAASVADVTFKYEDTDGNSLSSLKADVVESNEVGATVADIITSTLKASFYNGDESSRYDYSSFTCSDETVPADGATVILKFVPKAKYTYNVYAVDGSNNQLATITSATAYAGDESSLIWSKYVKVGEQWYVTSENAFATTVTAGGSKNVVYAISDIAYFFEMEGLTRSGGAYLTEENESYSGKNRLRISKGSMHFTSAIAAGVYTLNIGVANSNASSSEVYVYTRSAEGELSDVLYTHTATSGSSTINTIVTVPEGYSIAFKGNEGSSNNNARMDYMTLKKVDVTATIGTTGYTTFASNYALDLSNMTASTGDVTAYYASAASATAVTLTSTDATVAAGEGLILYGTPNATVTIPAAATGTAIEGNLLVGCPAETAITSATTGYANFYVLSADAAEFQNLEDYVAAGGTVTIPAGKAYLNAAKVSGAKLRVIFESEDATAISAIAAESVVNDGIIYNLNGQRVVKPLKGIYIQNGKKILVK
ncbi:MAG: hypothetical protein IJT97_09080 [Bacteroidaceae bacterium]|nr:hypothetical protein [Bacteroidaceae bacterium]